MKFEELIDIIKNAGIVGAGGAGFPTHAKLNTKIDTIVLNCAECEPLLKVDRQLMTAYTREILDTMLLLCQVLGSKGIIAIKGVYKSALEAVNAEIDAYDALELKVLPNIYPAGDEVVLIYEATGRVVPEGAIPASVGVVVLNVETVLNIYNAINKNEPVIYKYVTIAGEVRNPVTLKVPVGMKVDKAIELAGGSKLEEYKIIMGGPMTGRVCSPNAVITKTTKALLVLPVNHPVIAKKKLNTSVSLKRAMSTCSQCQMCTDLCPRNLLGHSIKPNRVMNSLAGGLVTNINDFVSTLLCSECGLCEMYSCHQGLSPRSLIKEVKDSLRKNGVRNPQKEFSTRVSNMRTQRMVPMERLISRLGLQDYLVDARLKEDVSEIRNVEIAMQQHIGAPCIPVVKKGDRVTLGQLIGVNPEGKLGANIHSSINGLVDIVKENSIVISKVSNVQAGDING